MKIANAAAAENRPIDFVINPSPRKSNLITLTTEGGPGGRLWAQSPASRRSATSLTVAGTPKPRKPDNFCNRLQSIATCQFRSRLMLMNIDLMVHRLIDRRFIDHRFIDHRFIDHRFIDHRFIDLRSIE
jgi:hypothetical protein